MSFKAHQELHASINKEFKNTAGEKNPKYINVSNDELKRHALDFATSLGRRFSNKEWLKYAKERGLPKTFSEYRKGIIGSVDDLAKWAAVELKFDFIEEDPRVVKTYKKMLELGYKCEIKNNHVFVEKTCEQCKNTYQISFEKREVACCSYKCSIKYSHVTKHINKPRKLNTDGLYAFHEKRSNTLKPEQARIYSELKFSLNRQPLMKEWQLVCKEQNISSRVGKSLKFGFKSYAEVIEAGEKYNHKVLKIEELPDLHTVYNITVDDNHIVGIITKINGSGEDISYNGIYTFQCRRDNIESRRFMPFDLYKSLFIC